MDLSQARGQLPVNGRIASGRPSAAGRPRASRTGAYQKTRPGQTSRTGAYPMARAQGGSPGSRPSQARQPRFSEPVRKRSAVPAIIAICVAVGVAAIGVVFALTRCAAPKASAPAREAGQPVEVVIPQGAGGDVIVSTLSEAGVITDETAFMQEVANQRADQRLQPGTYLLYTGMAPADVVRQLMAGPNAAGARLTVPEGLTVTQTADAVEAALGISADEFLAQAKASNYVADYDFLQMAADDSLEGFLWAKTYEFSGLDPTADMVIRAMLDQYALEIPSIDFGAGEAKISADYGITASDYDILKLASIIQREATTPEDLPLVSSVFWNRMAIGMPLQSDATMGYSTGGEVTAEDLQREDPYNTYTYQGLPPTPICTPDLACIEAALNPASTDYLYFWIVDRDGYSDHSFSTTYEEHLAAIDRSTSEMAELGL